MALLREEARAILQFALIAADAGPTTRARAAAAVKVKIGRAARHIAEQAVQLHGGMGVTEELSIGAYLKRVLRFELTFGSVDHHLQRYAGLARTQGVLAHGLITDAPAPARAAAG
jgi:alkylation response protein AidB-like acyl-CoA dehydrogenase